MRIYLTQGIQDELDNNDRLYSIVAHIKKVCQSPDILNDEMLKDFQIWQVQDKEVFCQADTDKPKLFNKRTTHGSLKNIGE